MATNRVFSADADAAQMVSAVAMARGTFRYFWREMYWEGRRTLGAVDLGMVKAAFQDGDVVEHMWVNNVYFDGYAIQGVLANQPNQIRTVSQGDIVQFGLDDDLTDWLIVWMGRVLGGFSIHEIRSQLTPADLAGHDAAWGLPFGDPNNPDLPDDIGKNHPMAESMVKKVTKFLRRNPSELHATDPDGFTVLHHEALAGNAPLIQALLSLGADKNAKTVRGDTPLDLAMKLGWKAEIQLLQ